MVHCLHSAAESITEESGLAQLEREVTMIEQLAVGEQQRGEQVLTAASNFCTW